MKTIKNQTLITLITLTFIILLSGTVSAADWTVGPDGSYNYQAIQSAVDGSADADTITVYPNGTGVYNENVVVNKNLTLKANSSATVVNGSFTVTAAGNGSAIEGFTVNYANSAYFSENFDGVTAPTLPAGWAVVDVTGSSGNWETHVGTRHPSNFAAHSGPNLAYFNSYSASQGYSTRLYRTSGIDLSGVSTAYFSFWMFHDTGYSNYGDHVQAQISTDGGNTWNTIATLLRNDGSIGWKQHTYDISAYTGMNDVRIGFLGISSYGNDCHIDDVTVTGPSAINSNPDGIYLNGASQVTVKGNTIHGFKTGNGIYLFNSNSNTINENTINGQNVNGISLSNSCTYNLLSGNIVTGSSNNGIYLNQDSNYNNLLNNLVTNSGYGIYLNVYCNYNNIEGNNVNGSLFDGVTMGASTGNTIKNNTITNNQRYGFWSNYYGNTITGNTIIDNVRGIGLNNYVENGQSESIHYNRIANNSQYNLIYLQPVSHGTPDATKNWWGSNQQSEIASKISGTVNYSPWLFMTINANPNPINNRETSQITVSFNNYSPDGTSYTPFNPATGHLPDGTPVLFQTDKGSIGSKIIGKTTLMGLATATLTADETAGMAGINGTTDAQTLSTEVTINPKSSLYLNVTPSTNNPLAGETVTYTLKVGNNGPDPADNVVMTYTLPEGMEFVGASDDVGNTWTYDPNTRTITWTLGTVPVGDPTLLLNLRFLRAGNFLINPLLATTTYDPTLNQETQSLTVNAQAAPLVNPTGTTVEAKSITQGTVAMQTTGTPLTGIALAILMVMGGMVSARRK